MSWAGSHVDGAATPGEKAVEAIDAALDAWVAGMRRRLTFMVSCAETASGKQLDNVGGLIGVKRSGNVPDEVYRGQVIVGVANLLKDAIDKDRVEGEKDRVRFAEATGR